MSLKTSMRIVTLLILLALSFESLAQKKVTLSGYIRDAESGESLIGATVYIKETQQKQVRSIINNCTVRKINTLVKHHVKITT